MNTDLPFLSTALSERVIALTKDVVTLNCLGVVTGPNGTGKTESLKRAAIRYATLGLDGAAHYHRACPTQGPTRGVKDILIEFGVRSGHVNAGSLQIACKLALREFTNRKIRLLLLDEADNLAKDSLAGVITMLDYCNQHGHKLGIVLAAAQEISFWLEAHASGVSRTVRAERSQCLSIEETLSALREWIPGLAPLVAKALTQDAASLKFARLIHKGVGDGNFRRMEYFAKLLRTQEKVDEETIKAVLVKITSIAK